MEIEANLSSDEQFLEVNNERRWRLSYLKDQFEALELHKLFNRYTERISHGYFSQFLSLQIILVTTHLIVLLVESHPSQVVPDIILYAVISALSIAILIITDSYVKQYPRLLKIFASCAFVLIFFTNIFIPYYYRETDKLRPAYTTYLIISNYILLNIHDTLVAFVLGLFVSIFHIVTLILVTYENSDQLVQRIASDTIFLICINGMGIYFRYMNEIVIRRSFLDRRSCVESTLQLNFEEDQENQLMSSIIPKHIIDKVKADIMKYLDISRKLSDMPKRRPFEDLYVQSHENVTILFADIVMYTAMTTELCNNNNITVLLEILNELFGRFDDASEELKVLRIKFLGDCYYCVAGLPPDPAPNHAEACVDLGLKMISIIKDIRERIHFNIDMRIGIHSGRINSGIIGSIKWQYDVWSTDVDIANKMETEGTAGMVHITRQTKELLQKSYDIQPSHKIVNNEETFLIRPAPVQELLRENSVTYTETSEVNDDNMPNQRRSTIYKKRNTFPTNDLRHSTSNNSLNNHRITSNGVLSENYDSQNGEIYESPIRKYRYTLPNSSEKRISNSPSVSISHRRTNLNARISTERRLTHGDGKRRTAFMNNNIKRYKERLELTNKQLEETIENMLLTKFEQWFKVNEVNRIFLTFKNLKSELNFITIPDPLFKYYLICLVLLVLLVYVIENLTLSRWDEPSWAFYTLLGITCFGFLPLTWTHHLYVKYFASYENDIPKNKIVAFCYNASKVITHSVISRGIIYTIVYALFCAYVLTEWIECESNINPKDNLLSLMFRRVFTYPSESKLHCIVPWHMTETCALAIIMSFLFLRMYMWVKFLYASIITLVYSMAVSQFTGEFYGDSQTFNYTLKPNISHILSVVFLTVTLHLVDRQTEYMNRLDHLWYETLIEKQKKANSVHVVNKVLLKNILPIHVADLYLNVNRRTSEDLFNEHFDDAAVMFASIVNFSVEDMGNKFLSTMNTIICSFDALSVGNTFGWPIEKIKVAKWTYMAASGLIPGLGNIENIQKDRGDHAVISLLKFAVSLMKKLQEINPGAQQDMKLRIGISYGSIAAGVVGSKKPLYDIWGDPVNMASRMDTTGIPNRIQVLKPTAEIIERFGYVCEHRGDVIVKGRDYPVSTYFVALDENFNLIRRTSFD